MKPEDTIIPTNEAERHARLAAPLVLDLIRFTEREHRRGKAGIMRHLASFFKSPMGENVPPEFHKQYLLLEQWADNP